MVLTEIVRAFEEKLGALADSIRAKAGLTGDLTLDQMKTAVDSIETGGGGGLPSGIENIAIGSIDITSELAITQQTFSHTLGVKPDLLIVYAPQNIETSYSMLFALRWSTIAYRSSAHDSYMFYHSNTTTSVMLNNSNSTTSGVSNVTATSFNLASCGSSYFWRVGTYRYLAIKFS